MAKTKILYVEDELALANIVKDTLIDQGYEVNLVSDGAQVIELCKSFQPDICLLDVMLPNLDGFSIAQRLQQEKTKVPIIFLTAKNQTQDVVKGFKSGGNDYLRKPFSLEELLLRIENILNLKNGLSKKEKQDIIFIGRYQFHPHKLLLSINNKDRLLTHRESEIIQAFAQHINGTIQRKDLLLDIWGNDTIYNSRNLDVYINKLRDFFSEDPRISIITLRGLGYRFLVDVST